MLSRLSSTPRVNLTIETKTKTIVETIVETIVVVLVVCSIKQVNGI